MLLYIFSHIIFSYYCVYYIVCIYFYKYICVCIKIYTAYIQNGVFLAADALLMYLELLTSLLLLPDWLNGATSLLYES